MILNEINDRLVADQLQIEDSQKYTFFLSHLSTDFIVEGNFQQSIYTSSHIGNILCSVKKGIPSRCIRILKNGEKQSLILSNGRTVIVTMFKDEEASGNVLFHFETDCCTALYLGHFKEITKIMWNKNFIDLISKGVDYLYIDNTNSESVYHSTALEVGYKIKELLKSHTKIIMNTPQFGYEDLIKTFIVNFDFQVYIRDDITRTVFYNTSYKTKFLTVNNDYRIALIMDSANLDLIERRLNTKNIATVRLFDFQKKFEYNKYEKLGLYQLCYSSHISQIEMFAFITLIQPKFIKEIYPEFSTIPNFIKSASKRWKLIDETAENISLNNELKDIEDFAPKTVVENPEQLQNFIEENLSNNQFNEKPENEPAKSSDCEEVCTSSDEIRKKINKAVFNIPRRKRFQQKTIVVDSSPDVVQDCAEHNQIKVEKEISPCKTQTSVFEKEKSKVTEFGSLMNANFSDFPSNVNIDDSEISEIVETTDTIAIVHSPKLRKNKFQTDQKQKEQNENFFFFLDNNSISSKERSSKGDEKHISNEAEIKAKSHATISYTLLEREMEEIHKDKVLNRTETNKKESSADYKISQKCTISNNTSSLSKDLVKQGNLGSKRKQQGTNEKNESTNIDSEKIAVNKNSNLQEHSSSINGIEKENERTQVRVIKEDANLKTVPGSFSVNKIIVSPRKVQDNISQKKLAKYSRNSTTKKRRLSSCNSVEAIEKCDEVIEIVDNSPPRSRVTRSSFKTKLNIEVRTKRVLKKSPVLKQMYIDDD